MRTIMLIVCSAGFGSALTFLIIWGQSFHGAAAAKVIKEEMDKERSKK